MLKILNMKKMSLEESIQTLHLNKDKPQYQNIYITNLESEFAYIYDGTKFIAVYKAEILNDLIDNHLTNIEMSIEEYKDQISPKNYAVLIEFIDMMNDEKTEFNYKPTKTKYDNYKEYKKASLTLLIYNNVDHINMVNVVYK